MCLAWWEKFLADILKYIFLIFPENRDLTFELSSEVSDTVIFLEKEEKYHLLSAENARRMRNMTGNKIRFCK